VTREASALVAEAVGPIGSFLAAVLDAREGGPAEATVGHALAGPGTAAVLVVRLLVLGSRRRGAADEATT
jgi:hypothetical protein